MLYRQPVTEPRYARDRDKTMTMSKSRKRVTVRTEEDLGRALGLSKPTQLRWNSARSSLSRWQKSFKQGGSLMPKLPSAPERQERE